jgi:hypothetical protein
VEPLAEKLQARILVPLDVGKNFTLADLVAYQGMSRSRPPSPGRGVPNHSAHGDPSRKARRYPGSAVEHCWDDKR